MAANFRVRVNVNAMINSPILVDLRTLLAETSLSSGVVWGLAAGGSERHRV
jgi:hypothetical protein